MIFVGICLVLFAGCSAYQSDHQNKVLEAAREASAKRSTAASSSGQYPTYQDAPIATGRPTYQPRTSPSPTPVYVYEDKYSSENHKCDQPEAILIEIYHFKCGYGRDGVLRWLKDEKATIEANKAESERYWAENGGLPGTPGSRDAPLSPPVPDRYTGPRCYAPGGKTYTPC